MLLPMHPCYAAVCDKIPNQSSNNNCINYNQSNYTIHISSSLFNYKEENKNPEVHTIFRHWIIVTVCWLSYFLSSGFYAISFYNFNSFIDFQQFAVFLINKFLFSPFRCVYGFEPFNNLFVNICKMFICLFAFCALKHLQFFFILSVFAFFSFNFMYLRMGSKIYYWRILSM